MNFCIKIILVFSICSLCIPYQAFTAKNVADMTVKERSELMRTVGEIDLEFYGKVLDFEGKPVQGAKVEIRVGYISKFPYKRGTKKTIHVTSNAKGIFVLSGVDGYSIVIKNISKQGYEFLLRKQKKYIFEYLAPLKKNMFIPDAKKPMVFQIRKKSQPTMVVPGQLEARVNADTNGNIVDFLRHVSIALKKSYKPVEKMKKGEVDLIVKAEKIAGQSGHYLIKFLSPENYKKNIESLPAGFIPLDEELWEAPKSGYKKEFIIDTREHDENNYRKFLYIKSRDGQVYTKARISYGLLADRVFVYFDIMSNPKGGRSFEYDPDLYNAYIEERKGKR